MKLNFERVIDGDTITYMRGNEKLFWMTETIEDTNAELKVGGELQSDTVHELQDEIMALASVGADIVVDLSEVTYVAVVHMRSFLNAQLALDESGKGSLKLTHLAPSIYAEMEKTGLTELLWIE